MYITIWGHHGSTNNPTCTNLSQPTVRRLWISVQSFHMSQTRHKLSNHQGNETDKYLQLVRLQHTIRGYYTTLEVPMSQKTQA